MTATLLIILISFIILCILYFSGNGPRESWDPDLESGALSILERRKDKLLRVLKDLDDEHEMGTIEKTEYLQLRRSFGPGLFLRGSCPLGLLSLGNRNQQQDKQQRPNRPGNGHRDESF